MRHPFDGIVTPASSRRGWLGGMLAGVAGLFFASRATAQAPADKKADTEADVDPEPKRRKTVAKPTTEALNEEAAVTKALNEAITRARGEAMTQALNEGGIRVTTLAL